MDSLWHPLMLLQGAELIHCPVTFHDIGILQLPSVLVWVVMNNVAMGTLGAHFVLSLHRSGVTRSKVTLLYSSLLLSS